ncbi:MAG: alpha-amylase [Elusimicrobia bacterium]|nr:alpha-amylase [Elusimicrobiota bacterium]
MLHGLVDVRRHLKLLQSSAKKSVYWVPNLWVDEDFSQPTRLVSVDPFEFFLGKIDEILASPAAPRIKGEGGDWTKKAAVYNFYVRLTTAFDHNQNGKLDLSLNEDGFRETGSFLKSIALLPYIRRLGVNTIHLLPVTAIGKDGKKGTLGSPYAIRNPFQLDENLCEPFLGLGVEKEFKAFVEAAHHLGMRVVVEFVFRTASRDSDWVAEHPEWFYWIREEAPNRTSPNQDESFFGSPVFGPETLSQIHDRIGRGDLSNTIPPSPAYRNFFTETPDKSQVYKEGERWVGALSNGVRVKIPPAFADWPPDDPQPAWDDVTYLKMYQHPDFNYMAYNTIRMYDSELSQAKNATLSLWETLIDIIPMHQKKFEIDGVMIDMGHALPNALLARMVAKARELDPEFAFWEENFNASHESKKHGYNACIGYLWVDQPHLYKLRGLLERYERESFPIPFFGTPESHNSPRSVCRRGGVSYSKFAWAINSFLPVLSYIHSGFELAESHPVNTGLDFSLENLVRYPAENLPLFSPGSLNWLNSEQFCGWLAQIAAVRKTYRDLVVNSDHATFKFLRYDPHDVIAFERKDSMGRLLVVGNFNMERAIPFNYWFGDGALLFDVISRKSFEKELTLHLSPGEVRILKHL